MFSKLIKKFKGNPPREYVSKLESIEHLLWVADFCIPKTQQLSYKPMMASEFYGEENLRDPDISGYYVDQAKNNPLLHSYFLPVVEFNKLFFTNGNLPFGIAMSNLDYNTKIFRSGWTEKGRFIRKIKTDNGDRLFSFHEPITSFNTVYFQPSMEDMVAKDWHIRNINLVEPY